MGGTSRNAQTQGAAETTRIDIEQYFDKARNHLKTLTAAHAGTWGLGTSYGWDADQETGIIVTAVFRLRLKRRFGLSFLFLQDIYS